MLLTSLAIAWAGLVTWLIARAVGQYRGYEVIHPGPGLGEDEAPLLAVIVPARNEAHNIERCLAGLVAQDYPATRFHVTVVDDNSTDGTAAIVDRIAATHPGVQLLRGRPLPSGWAGKPHACWQAAAAAPGEWLCFIDADTAAGPALLSTAVRVARTRGIDMLSLEPFQELGTFWERLIIPAGFFLLAFSQDLRRVNDPAAADAVANGQFILVRRQAYEAVGGHAAVRRAMSEDSALARRVKAAGYRLAVLGTEGLIRTRMYAGLAALWEGLLRTIPEIVGSTRTTVGFAIAALLLAWAAVLLPVWALVHLLRTPVTGLTAGSFGLALLGSLALFGTQVGGACYFRIPFWYGLLFPLGYTAGALVALASVVKRGCGQVAWKGRVYAPPPPQGAAGA